MMSFVAVLGPARNVLASPGKSEAVICDDVSDPATLDPQKQFTEKNRTILQHIYEELIRLNSDGKFEPWLAESWKRLNPLTVRFRLRQGVFFHNGEPFDAESVRFTIQRYVDPATGFPGAPFVVSIASATVIDKYTVDIHTHFPDGILLYRLAVIVLIVPSQHPQQSEPYNLEEKPVGTGPFVFDQWKKGNQVVLKANRNYWRKEVPKIQSLQFKFLPVDGQLDALGKGEVDLVTELPGTQTLKFKENPKTDVIKRETFSTVAGLFNTSKPPLSDKRVRQAINHAVNKEELIRYDLLGNGKILASLTMSGEVGHNSTLVPYKYDLDLARQLLKEAGFSNGFTLKTLVRSQGERTAKIIAKQLEAINVKLEIQAVRSDADIIAAFQTGGWDFGVASLPDPMAHSFFIQSIILYSRSPFSLMKSPDYDRLLEQMVTEIDPQKQEVLARALDKYVYDESLGVFTYQRIRTYGISKRFHFTPYITGIHYFDEVEIH